MLPKQLKYGSKIESAAARSSRVNVAPINGTGPYNLGDTIIIQLPTRSNIVLATGESYLKFTLQGITCAAASSLRLDSCGAHGLIQRIRVYHGSNLLEDIDNYGLLAKMLFDIQVPTDSAYGKFNVLCGTRNDLSALVSTVIATAADPVQCLQVCSGEQLTSTNNNNKTLANGETTNAVTYCLNLISILGTLSSAQYFPLMACTSAPIRLEILLIDNLVKGLNTVTAGTLGGLTGFVTGVEYIANIIELGDSAVQMIESSLEGQPLQYTFADFRNYQFNYSILNGSATQVTMPIPAKFSSLKSLFMAMRDKGTGAVTFYPFSCVNMGLTDYQFRLGANIVPSKAVATTTEQFAELIKAIGSMSDLNFQPNISKTSYLNTTSLPNSVALDTYGGTNVGSGAFFLGLDLENYVSASKDAIFAGWNSNTDDIFCIMNFSGIPAAAQARFDAYALFDVVLCFENGTAFVRY